jgi:hypothetical protein
MHASQLFSCHRLDEFADVAGVLELYLFPVGLGGVASVQVCPVTAVEGAVVEGELLTSSNLPSRN